MSSFKQFADTLKTDKDLHDLSEEQIQAIVDIFVFSIHADGVVGFMEEMEFEHLLEELPWFDGKQHDVHWYTEEAVKKGVHTEAGKNVVAKEAAATLTDSAIRDKVLVMAAELAGSDGHVHEEEIRFIELIGNALAIDAARIKAIVAAAEG